MRRWVWVLAITMLVAGRTAAHAQKPTAGWVRSDLKPVTQPELAGGLLILYVAAGGGLQVEGLDPKTGKTLWRDNASTGAVTAGVPPAVGVAGSTVVFLSLIHI